METEWKTEQGISMDEYCKHIRDGNERQNLAEVLLATAEICLMLDDKPASIPTEGKPTLVFHPSVKFDAELHRAVSNALAMDESCGPFHYN